MMIEFQCGNFSGYDKVRQQYVECGNKLIVSDEKIGEFVVCPKCKQQVEVPFGLESAGRKKSVTRENVQDRTAPAASAGSKTPREKSRSKTKPRAGKSKRAKGQQPGRGSELKLAEPVKRPSSDLSSLSFGGSETDSKLPADNRPRCAKCGHFLNKSGRCESCGYVEQKFEKATQPIQDIKVGLAGFQLWFCETMTQGVSINALKYGAHFSLGFIALMLVVLAILGIGGWIGALMVVVIAGCVALYVGLVVKGQQLASDPQAKLAWFQKPFWNAILFAARAMNWQNYDDRYKGRKIIDCRGEGITDGKIRELEGLGLCEVLDLERTPVTDQGLRQLYGLKNLHCVVLRKTQVTHEGVFRLQQTHPKIWIWY